MNTPAPARVRRHIAALSAALALSLPVVVGSAAPLLLTVAPAHAVLMSDGADLLTAVQKGDADAVAAALAAHADVNARDKDGRTALMLAASAGRTDLVQTLLDAGADPNAQDGAGRTALHLVLGGAAAEAAPKKKGFGRFLDQAKGVGGKALGALGKAGPLAYLIPGGAALQGLAGGMVGQGLPAMLANGFKLDGRESWSGVLGAAMLGGAGKDSAAFGALLSSFDGAGSSPAAPAAWASLLSAAGKGRPDVLKAMNGLGGSALADPAQAAAWAQFVAAAQTGNADAVKSVLDANPSLSPLLAKAQEGLRAAAQQIPGRDGGEGIVRALLAKAADAARPDKDGATALQRARDRKLEVVSSLLETAASGGATTAQSTPAPEVPPGG